MEINDIQPGAKVILNRDMAVRHPHATHSMNVIPRWTGGRIVPLIPRHDVENVDVLMIAVAYDMGSTYWTPAEYLDRSAIQ